VRHEYALLIAEARDELSHIISELFDVVLGDGPWLVRLPVAAHIHSHHPEKYQVNVYWEISVAGLV